MSEPTLDWSTAEVRDGKLSVSLDGEVPEGWKQTFETTVRLLGAGDWEEIKLKKDTVRVTDVSPGTEERLRHLLESAVQEANANHGLDEEPAQDEVQDATDGDANADDAPESPDAEMTERFRSFAA